MELERFIDIILKKTESLKVTVDVYNNSDNKKEDDYRIIEEELFYTLSLLGAVIDRVRTRLPDTILGLKYVLNYSKHGKESFIYNKVSTAHTAVYPMTYDYSHSFPYLVWNELPYDGYKINELQYKKYNSHIANKTILTIIKELEEWIVSIDPRNKNK